MSCSKARESISAIYSSNEIDDCIRKLIIPNNREDFKHEVFLILLQIPCDEIVRMNGTFKFYVVRIILNLARQRNNIYHRLYIDKTVEYNSDKLAYETSSPADFDSMQERVSREEQELMDVQRLKTIDQEMGKKDFPVYWATLKALVECGSFRKLEQQTGIPAGTAHRTIQKIRDQLKK